MRPLRRTACVCLLWVGCVSIPLLSIPLLVGCATTPPPVPTPPALTPARLYPLVAGSVWSYDVDAGDGSSVLAIMRVTESGAGHAAVQGGEGTTRYELRPDGIYRPDRGGYLLKEPLRVGASWPSGGGVQAEIAATEVAIETPAGRFARCFEVLERGAANGAVISTTYCPDVGPVQVVSSLQLTTGSVRVIARLRGYQIGGSNTAPSDDSPTAQ
jgi:hypothetical protein